MRQRVVTVVGGSGFLGSYVVKKLVRQNYTVRVLCRHPERAGALKTQGEVGQVVLQYADMAQPETMKGKLDGSYAVINLVGILFEGGRQRFDRLHAQGAASLARQAKAVGAERFVQISALRADTASSHYARSKIAGEQAVRTVFPQATILRPGVLFGPEDNFLNKFASMAALAPALPLVGGGDTLFEPVYAGDVAKAIAAAIKRDDAAGRLYELGGPGRYRFRDIMAYILDATGRKRWLMPLPFPLASVIGFFGEFLPTPPLTRDQVRSLRTDNVVSPDALTFRDLDIEAVAMETIAPEYLARYRRPNPQQPG